MIDDRNFYSEKELDAINYFEGKSFYARYQDLSIALNIYMTPDNLFVENA